MILLYVCSYVQVSSSWCWEGPGIHIRYFTNQIFNLRRVGSCDAELCHLTVKTHRLKIKGIICVQVLLDDKFSEVRLPLSRSSQVFWGTGEKSIYLMETEEQMPNFEGNRGTKTIFGEQGT